MTRDRIATLDVVRGVAVLGILAMNIVAFGMPEVAYLNPSSYGGTHGADLVAWTLAFMLVDGKMRGLFSFLFGASMLLVIDRAEARGASAARVHYARMVTLLLFGLAHLVLVWWGDILTLYALVGMIAFAFRRAPLDRLYVVAGLLLVLDMASLAALPGEVWRIERLVAGGHASAGTLAAWRGYAEAFGASDPGAIARDLALHRGGYVGLVTARWRDALSDSATNLAFSGPETLAYMLLGLAGLRSGMLTGSWPRARYARCAAWTLGIGLPFYAALAAVMIATRFEPGTLVLCLLIVSVPIRPVMIAGYACLIVWLAGANGRLTARFAAAGRMAFSNYLLTSLICTTVFYGYGLGLFGHLSRAQLYLVALPVWAAMLLWSKPWLERFRYGPLEWLWRSLARARLQPMLARRLK